MSDPIFKYTAFNPFGLSDVGNQASPTFVDIDGDGDLDAFVGESYGNTKFLKNTGTVNNPVFSDQGNNPFGLPDLSYWSSPTLVDIDNDNDLDAFIGDYYGNTYFSRNVGSASTPLFETATYNPLGLTDVGYQAKPSFVDIDGDGDLDAFVGSGDGYYGSQSGDTVFFRNTGTADNPAFTVIGRNLFGLSNVASDASPSFVDIDGDNDMDAFIGNGTGDTQFFRNIGSASNPLFATTELNPFGLVDVGYAAAPDFVDIDSDGDLDAFIGDSTGNTKFFVNNGLLVASSSGNDSLAGTLSNNDTATYASATSKVTVSLLITTQQNTIGAGLDTLISVENLTGSNYDDSLTGNSLNNVLDGKAGNDILAGWNGADTMIGGSGNDTYFVENVGDKAIEKLNEGIDTVSSKITHTLSDNVENLTFTGAAAIDGTGNNLANVITGNNAVNTLNGGIGNDTLNGAGGNDTLIGWNDADTMNGGTGNDTYFIENVGDKAIEKLNEGIDSVSSKITHTLSANVENLTLTGTAVINATGNDLANVITGNNASNQLTGGAGNDIFKFITKGPSDKITDYNVASDTVQLENAAFTALTTGALIASQFKVGTQATDANDFIIYNKPTGALLYDVDGNGATNAIQIAIIGAGLNLTNADIVVI